MSRIVILFLSLWLTGCATTAASGWTRFSDGSLNEWLDEEVIPGLTKTLSEHPRFRNETIRIAALDNRKVAERTNGLTTAVRDAVYSSLLQQPGLDIIRVEGPDTCPVTPINGYFLAIESSQSGSRGGSLQLRLYDIVEQQWISGFSYQWRGNLTPAQRRALDRTITAESVRGMRALPYTPDQSDLLAQRLAADLACHLRQRGDDELIVQPARDGGAALIAGNLAAKHRIPVGTAGQFELETRVHKVGNQLYQVWALLTPTTAGDDVSAIATNAYATRPLLKPTSTQHSTPVPVAQSIVVPAVAPARQTALLSPLRVIAVAQNGKCDKDWQRGPRHPGKQPVIAADSCFGLEFERHPATQVFIISRRVDAGLHRLFPSGCTRNAIANGNTVVQFPRHHSPLRWDNRSGTETFFVIAARGSSAISRVDRLLRQLPDDCHSGSHAQPADSGWLDEIDHLARTLDNDVAWQAVRVYHQPRADRTRLDEIRGAGR